MENLVENSPKKRRMKGESRVHSENKIKRCEGKSYITNNNKLVRAKEEPKMEISCKCKYNCRKISHEHKVKIFKDFYNMKDNVLQNSYLMGLISICGVKRRRHDQRDIPENSRRQAIVSFSIPDVKGDILEVCKKTFLEVHGLTDRRIYTLVKAKKAGEVVYVEKRGNKKKNRKFSPNDEALVIKHINLFPREGSHCSTSNSTIEYLSQELNIHRLFISFKQRHPQSQISYRFYYMTFKTKFPNLRFHHPCTDTCDTSDESLI